jgi:pimeloyl-ACP methyl ester carboxylesterase
VRGEASGLPLLLYLHGGPGDAALPLVHKYNSAWESKFTVVIWEQRGAGKSYYPFSTDDNITIQTFIDDMHCIVNLLLKRFRQEKIYLLGHSWGSVLGLTFIQRHPELVHTYIGCGQVVDMQKGALHQKEYALAESKKRGKKGALKRISSVDLSYTQENWLDDLLFMTKLVVKYKGSLYGKTNYNKLIKDFIFSGEYGLKDLLNREKGSLQSIKYLWHELMTVSFLATTQYEVPVVFIEGRHDHHVSSTLAKEYYDTITSPKSFHWLEKSCHFPQWSEPKIFNKIMLSLAP